MKKRYKIIGSIIGPYFYAFFTMQECFNIIDCSTSFIAATATGFFLFAICALIGCITFLTNKGQTFWSLTFGCSVVLTAYLFLAQLAQSNM
ncbi:hypothetical protein OAY89_00985 [Bacteroidota bacterium]|nr:hypothetical protein [Bacteroidota bacterium]